MTAFVLIFCIILSLLGYLWSRVLVHYKYWELRGIAYEPPDLIFGNFKGIGRTCSFYDLWLRFYKRFKGTGPFVGFFWFFQPAVFVLETSLIKDILIKDFHKFTDRNFYSNEKDDPLTGQLFNLNGQRWQTMRHKLSPTFTSGKMKFMFSTVVKVGEELVKVVAETLESSQTVEVVDLMARFTTDVIGTCAFGIDCNSLKNSDAEFRQMGKKALVDTRYGPIGIAFTDSFPEFSRKLHLKRNTQEVEDFFLGMVRETVKQREQHKIRRNDFMDILIDLKNTGEEPKLTIEEMAAQVFVFFQAGFETSSTTLGFALYELAQHQDIQQRAREEITAVLDQHDGILTYEAVNAMHYLNQITSETLRLYTVLPVLNRQCMEDYVVPNNPKYVIKAGMPVIIPVAAIHRDPDFYADPDQFNPRNFDTEVIDQHNRNLYLPFGDGPRNCIGMRFGQMQVRIGLALLLKNFRFSVSDRTQIPLKFDKNTFLLKSESGIYLNVESI